MVLLLASVILLVVTAPAEAALPLGTLTDRPGS
jgi:hypothetical protein